MGRFSVRTKFFGLIFLALLVSTFLFFRIWGSERTLRVENLKNTFESRPSDLWFTPDGILAVLESAEGGAWSLTLWTQSRDGIFDRERHASRNADLFAVSADARNFALVDDEVLTVESLDGPAGEVASVVSFDLKRGAKAVAVFFEPNALISVVYEDGQVKTYSIVDPDLNALGSSPVDVPCQVRSRGPFVVVVAPATGSVVRWSRDAAHRIDVYSPTVNYDILGVTAFTALEDGRLLVGTDDGELHVIQEGDDPESFTLPSGEEIRSIASSGSDILVAGLFRGIYWMDGGNLGQPVLITQSPESIDHSDAHGDIIAVASGGRVKIGKLREDRVIAERGNLLFGIFANFVSLLGFVVSTIWDLKLSKP